MVYIVPGEVHASDSTCAETNDIMESGEIGNRSLQVRSLSLMFVAELDRLVGFRDPLRAERACLYLHQGRPSSWGRLPQAWTTVPLTSILRLYP
jgi:hypothetical protein